MQSTLVMQQINFYDEIPEVSNDFSILQDQTSHENSSPQESHHHEPEKMKKVLHEPTSDLELEMQFAPVKKLKTINGMKIGENDDENNAQKASINSKRNEIEPSTDNENLTNEDTDFIKGAADGLIQEIKPIEEAFSNPPMNTLDAQTFPQISMELNQLNVPTLQDLNLLQNNLETDYRSILEKVNPKENVSETKDPDAMEFENKKENDNDPEDLIQQNQANILNSGQTTSISAEKPAVEKKKKGKVQASTPAIGENASPEGGKKRANKLQELRAMQEAYLIEWQKPYTIDIHIDPMNPNPKLKFTPIGQANQVKVPKLILNSSRPTRNQVKSLWKPVNFDQGFLNTLEGKIRKALGEKDINQEKVIELLKRFKMDDNLLIRELKRDIFTYKNSLKVCPKPQRKNVRRGQTSEELD